jgi:hypothetical protein
MIMYPTRMVGQLQAGPEGGVHGWTPQTRVSLALNPGYSMVEPLK